ncbi:hypothetical protein [Methylobacterium sp. PvR107]|uniref:hypothetical protein n=1 Tax=Methylobacterium sp. PvR107 TaxID=2806597 RepID=UPI001AE82E66|nr:hypothetical protein [Methylobacterium sp. PvR107]MBP1178674.1 hypothetical protein [Methylobacterium sp. PvR107]
MILKTSFVLQPFAMHRNRLRPAHQEPAQIEFVALKKAEARRTPSGRGGEEVVADDETSEIEGVPILGQFGNIPDDSVGTFQRG